MTSDERAVVANSLRKTHGIMAFVDALGIDFDGDWCWTDVSRRVADLIDPTCHIKLRQSDSDLTDERHYICSRCGKEIDVFKRRDYTLDGIVSHANYCKFCGARVTRGGE